MDIETTEPPFPTQEPSYVGSLGRAWKVDVPAFLAKRERRPDQDGTLAMWMIHAAYAHPVWHSYALVLIHLRDIPGQSEPAVIHLPGAQHEVCLVALHPDYPVTLDKFYFLSPTNFIGQFIEPTDEAAIARVERAMQDICNGKLNPDTDYIQHWIRRFSASNIKGDHCTAGETRIVVGDTEIVIPPQPAPND